jgi:hypothetical protein
MNRAESQQREFVQGLHNWEFATDRIGFQPVQSRGLRSAGCQAERGASVANVVQSRRCTFLNLLPDSRLR